MKLSTFVRTMLISALVPALALSVAVANLGAVSQAGGPRVLTNKAAFVGGERVIVSGYGFLPFELVTLQIEDRGAPVGAPWNVIADGHGRIESAWPLGADVRTGPELVVTALAGSTRTQAETTFQRTASLVTEKNRVAGSNFQPRENVALRLTPGDESWFVTADDEGEFTSSFQGDGATDLDASGEWSGLSARTLLIAGGFAIDGNIPDASAIQFGDPYGSASELGPVNATTTKLLPINTAAAPMLSFTNPNAQVDLRTIWMTTSVVSGDAWLYFAWERDSNSGSGVIAFEFQQAARPAACDYTKTDQVDSPANSPAGEAALIASCNPWANRQPGDFLIVWDQGGKAINIIKRTFYLDAATGKLALDAGVILSALDSAAAVSVDKFRGEGAINLSKTVFPQNPTSCFSIANIIPGTVTGNSDSADYKDTLLAEFASRVAVSNCGQVKVTKATQPAGGAGSFPYTLARQGGQALRFVADGGETSIADTLVADQDFDVHLKMIAAGNYTLTEGAVGPAWANIGITCDGTDVTGGTFTVLPSVLTECTITNKLQNGTLIVKKVVTNDNGGAAACGDFTFQVNGGSAVSFDADCQNEISVDSTVTYTVTEPAVASYATSYSNCSSIQVPAGGSATCTITNDDRPPSLRLVKSVTNNNGGTSTSAAWQLTAGGAGGFTDAGNSVVFHAVTAAVQYTLSESSVSGYDFVSWSCDGGTFVAPNKITLGLNQQVTCTVTNDDRKATPGVTTVERAVLHDAATVAGIRPGAPAPAATVLFRLYSDAACTTQIGVDETVGISAGGQATTVNGVLVTTPGTYYWRAFYSGDAFNAAFATACGSEVTTVGF
jgi:hypothetical protein